MANSDNLAYKIQEKRTHIHRLVGEKESLLDPDVLEVSRMLDDLLNELDRMQGKS